MCAVGGRRTAPIERHKKIQRHLREIRRTILSAAKAGVVLACTKGEGSRHHVLKY
ncbi:MAG TPA: hypothetical protein VEB88_05225 [Candidatus Acidoferrales bacterium]|nr:hypothetical protein [Candidatus Acidoferrales bacterium]